MPQCFDGFKIKSEQEERFVIVDENGIFIYQPLNAQVENEKIESWGIERFGE